MELDGRFHISKGLLIGITLSYYYAFNADRVGYIAIRMFLYYYCWLHSSLIQVVLENKAIAESFMSFNPNPSFIDHLFQYLFTYSGFEP